METQLLLWITVLNIPNILYTNEIILFTGLIDLLLDLIQSFLNTPHPKPKILFNFKLRQFYLPEFTVLHFKGQDTADSQDVET